MANRNIDDEEKRHDGNGSKGQGNITDQLVGNDIVGFPLNVHV